MGLAAGVLHQDCRGQTSRGAKRDPVCLKSPRPVLCASHLSLLLPSGVLPTGLGLGPGGHWHKITQAAGAHAHPAGPLPVPVRLWGQSLTSHPLGEGSPGLLPLKASSGPVVHSAERYDPLTGTWTSIAAMSTRRRYVRVAMLGG